MWKLLDALSAIVRLAEFGRWLGRVGRKERPSDANGPRTEAHTSGAVIGPEEPAREATGGGDQSLAHEARAALCLASTRPRSFAARYGVGVVALSVLVLAIAWLNDAFVGGIIAVVVVWLLTLWDYERESGGRAGNTRGTYVRVAILASGLTIAGELAIARSLAFAGAGIEGPLLMAALSVLLAGRLFRLHGTMAHVALVGVVYFVSTFGFGIVVILICQCL